MGILCKLTGNHTDTLAPTGQQCGVCPCITNKVIGRPNFLSAGRLKTGLLMLYSKYLYMYVSIKETLQTLELHNYGHIITVILINIDMTIIYQDNYIVLGTKYLY